MNVKTLSLVIITVSLAAVGQVLMKRGMSDPAVQQLLGSPLKVLWTVVGNGYVLLGILLYGISAVFWLFVLAELDVSLAYPFVALGFLLTMFLGAVILGEDVGTMRVAGTVLVGLGVILLARS